MLTDQTKPSIAAVSVTENIGSEQAKRVLLAAVNRRADEDFAMRSAGATTGRISRGNDTRPEKQDMRHGAWLSFRRSVGSVCGVALTTTEFLTLTTSKGKRNSNRSIAVTRRQFASRYGNRKCNYSRMVHITCKSCARIVTASKRGPRIIPDIACERITNAQRQERMFA